jgi:hypothetical protein
VRDTAIRPWVAKAQYPGLETFIAGTIIMPAEAQSHEIEQALLDHFHKFLPPGFQILDQMCGALFFVSEEETPCS